MPTGPATIQPRTTERLAQFVSSTDLDARGVHEPSLTSQLDEATHELLELTRSLQSESSQYSAKLSQDQYMRGSRFTTRRSQTVDPDDQACDHHG